MPVWRWLSMEPIVFWTALGVVVVIVGQIAQFVHLSIMIEKRFTTLEVHLAYMREDVHTLKSKRAGDSASVV